MGGAAGIDLLGETFAGRIAASLLDAIHLPELVTEIWKTTRPGRSSWRGIRTSWRASSASSQNRLTTPLFDTKLFTQHIEAAYAAMVERHRAGLAPDHIAVPGS